MENISYHRQKISMLRRMVLLFFLMFISYFYANAVVTIFSDDFSGSYPGAWDIGHDGGVGVYSWAWPDDYAHCYSDPYGLMYYYPDNLHVYMERRNVNLSGYSTASLSFYYIVDTEPGFDYFTVNVRDQYGSWHEMYLDSGEHSLTWVFKTINLDQFVGQTGLYIQFRFDSDGSVSGDPYDGTYVDNVQLTAEVPDPVPDLVSVSSIPTSVNVGNSFTMSVTAKNDGGGSPAGYISISYTNNPTLTNESGIGLSFTQYPPGYYPIYDKDGNPITAQDKLLDVYDSNWTGSESHTVSVTVTPQQSGTMYIYVRTNLKDNDSETYFTDCSVSGGDGFYTDQQGWVCKRFSVNVVGSYIDSISPSSGPRGKIVTLYGSNFGDSRGSSYVKFGTVTVDTNKYWVWSNDSIQVDVPVNAPLGLVGVVVHTSYGDSDPRNFYVTGNPYPSVNISGIPTGIKAGESFTFDVTLANNGGESDRGGLAISFPDLNQAHSGMSTQGPYDTSQARIETYSTTFPSSAVRYFDQGDDLADPPESQAQHLLVDGDTGPFSGSKTITLRVTPKQISDGVLTIKIRGFLSVGGPYGYEGIMYRDPNSSGTGIQQDQQLYWAYVRSVPITPPPKIVDKSLSTNTSRDGRTLTVGYRIENSGDPVSVGLGCSIVDPAGKEAFDVTNDITVTAQTGTYWYNRNFIVNLPAGAQTGTYDVAWGIWKIENGQRTELYEIQNEQDFLTIQGPNWVRVPILMYHKIGDTTYSDYWVTKREFQAQMEALKAYGYSSITLQDLSDYRAGIQSPPQKPVLITFDDGYQNLRTHAYPVFSASTINYKVTSFLPSGRLGGDNSWDADGLDPGEPIIQHLTWNDVAFIHNSGYVDFQSHTVTHPHLFQLTEAEWKSEFENSKQEIESHINKTVKFISWPFCEFNTSIQQTAYESGYFGAAECANAIETTSEDKWALKRLHIGSNISVDFDQYNPDNFFMNKIDDPDVKIPLIHIDSIEYLDPSTDQLLPDNRVIQGSQVKIRVKATNSGETAGVTVSLNIDDDSDHENGIIYDSHPADDLSTTFSNTQITFAWTWTVPLDAPLGQYYVAIGFHDQYYVLGYAYSGWQAAFNVLDDGISWEDPNTIANYNIFGHNHILREYEGGTRLVVFQNDGTGEKLVTDPSIIAALITYHAFRTEVPDLNINNQLDIQNAGNTWEDVHQKDYEYALKAAHDEYDEVCAQRLGEFQQRTFITAAGTVATTAASVALVVAVGIPTGGVGSVLLSGALISMGVMSFTLDTAGTVWQMKADEIGDEFSLDERVAWLKGIAFLDGDSRAREIFDELRNAPALAESWERLGQTYSTISDILTIVQSIAGIANIHSLPQLAFHIGSLGYKTFAEKPMTLNLDFHMDLDALKLRVEETKVNHLDMLWRLASHIATCYKYLDTSYNSTITADDFGRKLLTLTHARKLFLENKYEYYYSLYFRLYYWAHKGYTQGAYEFIDVDLTSLYNQWDSNFIELDVFTDKLADFQYLYQYYSGLAQLSYQELGIPYLGSVDVLMQNEGVPVEIEVGSPNTIELTAVNLSGQTLSNMELSLSPSDNSGIILTTTPIGSIPIDSTMTFDCDVQFPVSQNIGGHTVNCDVILKYDKGGENLERAANIKFLLTLPFSFTDIKPDKLFPKPGDVVNAVAYLASKHNSTVKITPTIYFSAAPELYTVILPQQTMSCGSLQKNECYFTWSGITAGMPKGVYAIMMEVEKSDGTEFEFDIPTFVYVIPEVNGNLAVVDLNNATIITPRADLEEGNKISKRIQNAFNIPDSNLYILDEHQGDLEILKRKDNLVLIGGNMANDLVADLVDRGKLPGNLWQNKGDAVVYVIEDPFYPSAPQGNHAVLVAGREIDDTYIAGISMIKHWQDMNQLDYIEIKGHTEVFENSWLEYDCIAYYTDGTQREVTPQWQVDSTYAEIYKTGLLTTYEVPSDQPCQISATYGEGSVVKTDIFQITIKDIPPAKVLNQIVIEGPNEVDENTSQDFNCRAYYSDGTNQLVEPQWNENSTHAEISSSGLLTTSYITSDQPCQISATYNEGGVDKSDTHDITIKDTLTFIPTIERNALIALYNSTNGDNWTNNSGWKDGQLEPDGFGPLGSEFNWYGIEISNGHVFGISLGDNNLQGSIPPEIGNLPNLHTVYMDNNQLSGNIPSQFGNLNNLENLYLNENQLIGIIPAELGNLSKLYYLDLSSNQLTGSIPAELGNTSELNYLDLSDNQLSGTIPAGLSNLPGWFWYLDLSSNQLSGSIPKELGIMSSLDYFDLSSNRLSGSIPVELANIGNLNHFDIGHNALYSQDAGLRAFLDSNDPDWESTQTTAPVGISANATSSSSVEISWTPINYTDNNGGYKIFYSTVPGGPWIESGMTENKTVSSYDVIDLDADMTYYFIIKTQTDPHVNNQNTVLSDESDEVSATTMPAPKILDHIIIEGPPTVDENSNQDYNCRAYYNNGTYNLVEPSWSEDSQHAEISPTGLLTTLEVDSHQPCQISASYTEGEISVNNVLQISIKDTTPSGMVYVNGTTGDDSTGERNNPGQPFKTIQAGINAALAGDMVSVAAGTYNEYLVLKNGIRLNGAGADNTIIVGGGSGTLVSADNILSTTITGFTFTNGSELVFVSSSCSLQNCIIENCQNGQYQGIVMIRGTEELPSHIDIRYNIFRNNRADYGPITLEYHARATIRNNIIVNNEIIERPYDKGMIDFAWGYNMGPVSADVINNVIAGNIGGGIYAGISSNAPHSTIINNIVVNNSGFGIVAIYDDVYMDYNNIWNNGEGDYRWGISPGIHDISQEPLFKGGDPFDYHLEVGSPCIDTGHPFILDPDGSRSDMGAYGSTTYIGDISPPLTHSHIPARGEIGISPSQNIVLQISDDSAGVNQTSIEMSVDGLIVTPEITGTPTNYTVTYNPPVDFVYGQEVHVTLNAFDLASPPNVMPVDSYSFVVISQANRPPYMPDNPIPPDTIGSHYIYGNMYWGDGEASPDDPDEGDVVTFYLYLDTNSDPQTLIWSGQSSHQRYYAALENDTQYYWKIIAEDKHGALTEGPVWSFTTESAAAVITSPLAIIEEFNAPAGDISGITWDGNNIWTCDQVSRNIYKHTNDSSLSVESVYDDPNPNSYYGASGMTWDGVNLWYSAKNYGTMEIHKLDQNITIIESKFGYQTDAIASIGQEILSGSSWTGRLHNTKNPFERDEIYDFGWQSNIYGMAWDGNYLWVAIENYLFKCGYDVSNPLYTNISQLERYTFAEKIGGLAWDGNYLWIACPESDKIYKVDPTCTLLSIESQPQSETIVYNSSTTLNVLVSETEPFTYQWYEGTPGDTTSPVGENSNTFTTPNLTQTTSYWVRISNSCDSVDSEEATITVYLPSDSEIRITQNLIEIPDGGSFDFETAAIGTSIEKTFKIENLGTENLTLDNLPLQITGDNSDQFSVVQQPGLSTIPPDGHTTFVLSFSPTSSGSKTASISIDNNDMDENPYDITLNGIGSDVVDSIRGRVINSTGNGIENIGVYVYNPDYNFITSVFTDNDGNFVVRDISEGDYKLYFSTTNAGNYFDEWYNDKGSFDAADIVYITSGQTTNPDDVQLEEYQDDPYEQNDTIETAAEVAAGTYSNLSCNDPDWFKINVPEGKVLQVEITRTIGSGWLELSLYDNNQHFIDGKGTSGSNMVTWTGPLTSGYYFIGISSYMGSYSYLMNIQIKDASEFGTISGRVTDGTNGIQDVGVRIHYLDAHYWALLFSDIDGNFSLLAAPGDYIIEFEATGNYISEYYNNKFRYEEADLVHVTAGSTTTLEDAVLEEGGIIGGRVIDSQGNGISSVYVEIYDLNNDQLCYSLTDSDGNYLVGGISIENFKVYFEPRWSGNYISEWYNDKVSFEEADTVSAAPGQTTTLEDTVLAEGGMISGRVTDGVNGIEGIRAMIYDLDYSYIDRSVYTDSNGDYMIQGILEGNYKVRFYSWGNFIGEWYDDKESFENADAVSVIVGQTTVLADAVLAEGGFISGLVTDGANGIEDVRVQVFDLNYNSVGSSSYTDSNGNYTIQGIPDGNYKVKFYNTGNFVGEWYNDKGSFDDADMVSVAAGQTTSGIDAVLAEGGSISGRVTDSQGNGIANVDVNVYDLNYSFVNDIFTDSNGYYTITTIPGGNHKVYFRGNSAGNYISEWYNDKGDFYLADEIVVNSGQTTSGIDAVLVEGGSICGRVSDGTDGIESVYIILYDLNYGYAAYAYSDSNGDYCFPAVAPGSYKVEFNASGSYFGEWYNDKNDFYTADEVVVLSGQVTPGVDAVLAEGGTISGRVTDSQGNGLAGVNLSAYDLNYSFLGSGYTDSNGYYTSSALPGGACKVYFRGYNAGNYLSEWYDDKESFEIADQVSVAVGETTALPDVVLAQGGRISGRVTDANGRGGIESVRVQAYDMNNSFISRAYTDSNGNYTLQAIPTGNCLVRFYTYGNYIGEWYNDKSDFNRADPVSVAAGQTTANIDAALEIGGSITGNVTDSSGKPIPDIDVYAYDLNGNYLAYSYTDPDGNYEVQAIPQGPCKVLFDPSSLNYYPQYYGEHNYAYEWYNDTENFNEAEIIRVSASQVIPGIDAVLNEGGSISGAITDGAGNGIKDILVVLYKDNSANNLYLAYGYSHGDGVYEVKGLSAGNYLVIFRAGQGYAGEFYNDVMFESAATLVPVTMGSETSDIDAVLVNAGTVSGRVTDTNGNGIGGVSVRLYDPINNEYLEWLGNVDRTDSNGYYTIFYASPGDRKVMFDTSEVETGSFVYEFYNDKQDINSADIITVQSEGTLPDINAVLSAGGGTLSGYVTDIRGLVLPGVSVEIYDTQYHSYRGGAITDSSGYFEVKGLVPGQYKVFFNLYNIFPSEWYNDRATFEDADAVAVTDGGNTSIRVILGGGEPGPSLNITSPRGGEILTVGSRYEITWEGTGEGNVIIEYSINGGRSWTTLSKSTPNNGRYDWTVPNEPSENCLIRISSGDADDGFSDISDTVFSIVVPPPSIITVISPNGGESLTVGSIYYITWTGSGNIENVTIEYSTDSGNSWQPVVPVTANSGSYGWTIPNTPADDCLVRIIGSDADGGPLDVSDAEFSIVSPSSASITVLFPNGGEQLQVGTIYNITWSTFGPGEVNNVKIECSTNAGNTWTEIIDSTTNNGSYPWTAMDSISDNCLIRVSDANGSASDISDAVFSMVPPPTITLTSPNGGESWNVGSTQGITWSSTGTIRSVKIEYSIDNGGSWLPIDTSVVNDGGFDWKVPDTPADNCLVRISEYNSDRVVSDTSDAVFSIATAPGITVTSPNGRERLIVGSTHEITWAANGVIGNVIIEYSVDNGESWTTIDPSGPNDGSHSWTIPDTPSEHCLVRIGQCEPGGPSDVSDDIFSITPESTITVTSPNGGENLTVGSKHLIAWTSTGMSEEDTVIIGYSTDNGGSWTTAAASAANNGSYNWTVPGTPADSCLIRISSSDGDTGPADVSDEVFSIVPIPDITVISPNGGEQLTAGTPYDITWSFSGEAEMEYVMIEYSVNNGVSWSSVDLSAGNSGSYSWTVPDDPSENCLVRVRGGDADNDPSDVSDSVFSIVPDIGLTVTSPNGGERLKTGSNYNIAWETTGISGDVNIDLYRGESFDCNIGKVSAETGRYEWKIPENFKEGEDYKILIFKDSTEDYSDASFSITEKEPNHPDFNNDGKVDILWRNYENGFNEVWYMDGAKFLGSMMLPAQPELEWRIAGTGDFNRDGKIDILWRQYKDGRNIVWYMNGTTLTGQEPLATRSDSNWQIVGTGDFNRDGSVDVLWRNTVDGENQVWYLKGVSKIGEGNLPPLEDQWWRISGTGDFNGDGKVDILWRNYETGKNEVWTMDGILRIGSIALVQLPGTDWRIVGTGDFNRDGATDLLWRCCSDGKNMIWTMDSVNRTGYEYLVTRPDLNWKVAGNGDYYQNDESQGSTSGRN